MAFRFKNLFNPKVNTNSVKNNTVTITSSNDVMYDIATKLGSIETNISHFMKDMTNIKKSIKNLDNRVRALENKQ